MKLGFAVLLTLALAALLTHYLMQGNGVSVIYFQGYEIKMSVPILGLLLVLGYFAVRMLVNLWAAPRKLGQYAAERKHRKAGERITRGYIELGEGNFARGEKLLTRGVRNSETPLLNYLAAARAAQSQGDTTRRDSWLNMALEQEPRASSAIQMAQAEMQLENQELDAARENLSAILDRNPKNSAALQLLTELCIAEGSWTELENLLPRVRKHANISTEQLDDWTVQTWAKLLAAKPIDAKRNKALMKKLPSQLRNHTQVLKAQVEACIADDRAADAEGLIRKALNQNWSDELVGLYGQLQTPAKAKLLKRVESWLKDRPEDPVLLLAAGRLCIQNKLWGKARSYFETSLGIQPTPEAWHELGRLLTEMGEAESASDAYQKGLVLSYGGTELPRLTVDLAADQ